MIDFQDISTRLKAIIIDKTGREKIRDKEIAEFLSLEAQYYAVIKRRNKIPYEAISYFCKKYNTNMNWILLAQKPRYLN